eukprot:COSAG01_NODE_58448_length_306_cov_0.671498_1_plen_94_part_01
MNGFMCIALATAGREFHTGCAACRAPHHCCSEPSGPNRDRGGDVLLISGNVILGGVPPGSLLAAASVAATLLVLALRRSSAWLWLPCAAVAAWG